MIKDRSTHSALKKALFVAAIMVIGSLLPVTAASADPADSQTRVIVTLATADAAPSSETIATITENLLGTLPTGDYTVINRPVALPYLTLSVGASAMSVLQSSSLVASIERDETVSKAASAAKTKTKCKRVKRKGKKVKVCKKVKAAPPATEIH